MNTTSSKKTAKLDFRITPSLRLLFVQYCSENNIKASTILRQTIIDVLDQKEK